VNYLVIGLVATLLGALLWVAGSVLGTFFNMLAVTSAGAGSRLVDNFELLMYVGFAMMCLAPVTFWIVLPLRKRIRRKKGA
jgi:hypothetical protein